MRSKLKELCGQRLRFVGHVVREGRRPIRYENGRTNYTKTLVLSDVTKLDDGEQVANHVWLEGLDIEITEGDIISFDASVREYTKARHRQDYALRDAKNAEILKTNV